MKQMIRCRVFAIVGAVLVGGAAVTQGAAAETVLITGANSGLGLEFVKQYAAKGWTVIATARQPEVAKDLMALAAKDADIKVERLDVVDDAQIAALPPSIVAKPSMLLLTTPAPSVIVMPNPSASSISTNFNRSWGSTCTVRSRCRKHLSAMSPRDEARRSP